MKLCDALEWFDLNAVIKTILKLCRYWRPNDQVQDEVCLIGKEKMKHKFTLKCGHSFEYDNILKELELQKISHIINVRIVDKHMIVSFLILRLILRLRTIMKNIVKTIVILGIII